MIVNENNTMPYMKSLVSCLKHMVNKGYTEDFKVTPMGLTTTKEIAYYQPEQVRVVNFFRFEGESDPDDNAILYVMETHDGTKGTLVDAYGIYNDPAVTQFIQQVQEIEKKIAKN
ncbi:MAG: hypothetical protein C4329_00715 [Chitinophagaceae bacterium]